MNNGQPTQHAKATITITRQAAQKPNGAETRTAPSPELKDPTEAKSPEVATPDPTPEEAATHQKRSEPENAKDAEAAPTSESENTDNKGDNSTATANQQPKRRTRKTIDQELAELEQRRAKLLEAKRKNETREKIVFGATVISCFIERRKDGDKNVENFCKIINDFVDKKNMKDAEIINNVISRIIDTK